MQNSVLFLLLYLHAFEKIALLGKNEIEPKFNAIIAQIRGKNSDDDDVRQFTTMVKYLAFAACAAKAPITQTLTKTS